MFVINRRSKKKKNKVGKVLHVQFCPAPFSLVQSYSLISLFIWKKVIVSIHGTSGKLLDGYTNHKRKGTWGNIAAIQKSLDPSNIRLNSLFQRSFGDGSNIKFWRDIWYGSNTLEERFPRLAAIDININCSIADRITRSSDGVVFCGRWRREIRNRREEREVADILEACRSLRVADKSDGWSWGLTPTGEFSTARGRGQHGFTPLWAADGLEQTGAYQS